MSLNDLQNKGLIKPIKASLSQAQDSIALAERDISTAKKLLGSDSDWAFSIAYNAVLQATRALMYFKGYRPTAREGHHVAAVYFAQEVLGKEIGEDIYIFDKMRQKRHRIIYDVAGTVSQQEVQAAFEFSVTFVKKVVEYLKKK